MSMDLSEFHDIFFEECYEGLSVMESGLLALDNGTDLEEINAIFRAAHSIKGGGASFGFMEISDFTHVMETLLDEMRDGRRDVSKDDVDLLLESVDVLRNMVEAAKEEGEADSARVTEVKNKLNAALDSESSDEGASGDSQAENATSESEEDGSTHSHWQIEFAPSDQIMLSGNEPTRIFRELERLGELHIEAHTNELPTLEDIHPQHNYLSWSLTLTANTTLEEIQELFSWVADDSELTIERMDAADEQVVAVNDAADDDTGTQEAAQAVNAEPAKENKPTKKAAAAQKESSGSIRVAIDKVDELINMVGELVITQSMLSQIGSLIDTVEHGSIEKLRDGLSQLERNTRELQESVLQIRMMPVSFAFSRFPRLVRDLSGTLGKKIELKMTGEQTEVDKTVLEKIGDPLVHLVRNSMDHGIEMPEDRLAAGKEETGTLELCAYHEGGDIIIQVNDDGAGLNRQRIYDKAVDKGLIEKGEELSDDRVYNLIFAPGFSTAEQLSDVSGRGVGMDVVRRNVRDLGGNVSISSNEGAGSTVTIRLPLTLAILDGQLVSVGKETYIVSLVSIVESLQMKGSAISSVAGQTELYQLRDEFIPIIRVNNVFGESQAQSELEGGLLMVVESDGKHYGLFVDDLLGQQQVVIKSLETNFRQVEGVSGATILGDGTVALIIDVPGLIQRYCEDCARLKRQMTEVA
ncbi:MAG: chemotaxis protein CheA [Halioglobus sp.]